MKYDRISGKIIGDGIDEIHACKDNKELVQLIEKYNKELRNEISWLKLIKTMNGDDWSETDDKINGYNCIIEMAVHKLEEKL